MNVPGFRYFSRALQWRRVQISQAGSWQTGPAVAGGSLETSSLVPDIKPTFVGSDRAAQFQATWSLSYSGETDKMGRRATGSYTNGMSPDHLRLPTHRYDPITGYYR
jgi:hypothetical protein